MTGSLSGKVALITGAAGGIGAATARALVREGASVSLVDRDAAALDQLARAIATEGGSAAQVLPLPADVSVPAEVSAYVERVAAELGGPHVLVSNAGIEGRMRAIHEYSEEEFDQVMSVNARATWLNLKAVVPRMIAAGGGSIVNVASGAALHSLPRLAPYVASKHAVLGLTRAAASDLAEHGIRVNAVCPGPVATRMMDSLEEQAAATQGTAGEARARLTEKIPLSRYGRPEEIAEVIVFLAGDGASFMTGAAVAVDGGITAV